MVALVDGVTADRDSNPTILSHVTGRVTIAGPNGRSGVTHVDFSDSYPEPIRVPTTGRSLCLLWAQSGGTIFPVFTVGRGAFVRIVRSGQLGLLCAHVSGKHGISSPSVPDTLCAGDAPEGDGPSAERSGNHRRNVCEIRGRKRLPAKDVLVAEPAAVPYSLSQKDAMAGK